MILKSYEKLEPLGNNINVIVSKDYTFSTDTLLLANFSNPLKHEKAAEIGTGCGAIPLFWISHKMTPKFTDAIEIQETASKMAKRSVEFNSLCDKINVITADARENIKEIKYGTYDLVVCNPPYKAVGCGILNLSDNKLIARHEVSLSIKDLCKAASKFLRFGGRLCLCNRIERLCDTIVFMRNFKIEPKLLRFVQQRENTPPKLFLIEGKKGRNPGIKVLPTLLLEDKLGNQSDELKEIYKYYGENKNAR